MEIVLRMAITSTAAVQISTPDQLVNYVNHEFDIKPKNSTKFYAIFLQIDLNPCASNPCLNGGNCTATSLKNFTCSCDSQYSGPNCQFSNTRFTFNSTEKLKPKK